NSGSNWSPIWRPSSAPRRRRRLRRPRWSLRRHSPTPRSRRAPARTARGPSPARRSSVPRAAAPRRRGFSMRGDGGRGTPPAPSSGTTRPPTPGSPTRPTPPDRPTSAGRWKRGSALITIRPVSAYALGVVAAAFAAYALVSRRLVSTPFTGPIVFVGLGLLIGPSGIGLLTSYANQHVYTTVFEATLVLVLFTDAMAVNRGSWRSE